MQELVTKSYFQKFLILPLILILIAVSSITAVAEEELTQEETVALELSIYGPNYQGVGAHINPDQYPAVPVKSSDDGLPIIASAVSPLEGCSCVVFRMDDVQDFFVRDLQIMIFDEFIDRDEKLAIGPIANFFNQTIPPFPATDTALVAETVAGVTSGHLELFNHGWNHTDFSAMNSAEQLSNMTTAQSKLTALFPSPPNVFVPPFNLWNADTETAMISNSITILSSQVTSEPIPGDIFVADGNHNVASSGLYHLPVSAFFEEPNPGPPADEPTDHTATSILADIDTSIAERGYAVVLLHPFEFSQFTGTWPNKSYNGTLNTAQYQDLTDVIDGVISKGYSIKTFNEVVAFNGTVSIGNVTQVEGTGGLTNFVFNVTRTGVGTLSVDYQTADGTATSSSSDYTALPQTTLNFGSAETLKTITVSIGTDSTIELAETFNVNLTNCVGCTLVDSQGPVAVGVGVGTITNDDFPDVSINNVTQIEGNSGASNFIFNVTRSSNVGAISVGFNSTHITTNSSDYNLITPSPLGFSNGGPTDLPITVSVNGDTEIELDEIFNIHLTPGVGYNIIGSPGVGTITNDDLPTITINDVTQIEGDVNNNFVFTVTRSSPVGTPSMQYSTATVTATSPSDFTSIALTSLNFTHNGPVTQTVNVLVIGDVSVEPNETFTVDLSNCIECIFNDSQGLGIILDDDMVGSHLQTIGSAGPGNGEFSLPSGVAVDSNDKIIVSDTGNNRIQTFTSAGTFSQTIGTGQLNGPSGVAVDSNDRIIAIDTNNNRIQIFDSSGTLVQTIGSTGNGDGQFNSPGSVAIDSNDRIIVADTGNNRIQIFDSSGVYQSKFGTQGIGDNQFKLPRGIAVDSNDRMIIADTNNHRIKIFDSSGVFQSQFGTIGTGAGQFLNPVGVDVKSGGKIMVTDTFNDRIQIFDSTGVHLQSFGSAGSSNGLFADPKDLSADSDGRVIVADTNNNRIQIFAANSINDLDLDTIPDELDPENIITSSITLSGSHTVVGNVSVQNGALVTIPNGLALTIQSGSNITIESGSGVLVKSGGTLQVNS